MSIYDHHVVAGTLKKAARNKYFYGKHLDVQQFELEQEYFNGKRWLLNRYVTGAGVVCGLNVVWVDSNKRDAFVVKPGLAIDRWGREIIVPSETPAVSVPPPSTEPATEEGVANKYVCLEYLECEADPVPALTDECGGGRRCMPDSIQERYRIAIHPGKAHRNHDRCSSLGLLDKDTGEIDYDLVAKWVSEKCGRRVEDTCIPLAELRHDPACSRYDIDVTVRPIVFTNDLLCEILRAISANRKEKHADDK
jgi:hypothetical protein